MRKLFLWTFSAVCITMPAFSQYDANKFWNKQGELQVDWSSLDAGRKAFVLERYRNEINYCVANIGAQFNNVDLLKVGNDKGYYEINKIDVGLIALKYLDDYRNPIKSIPYFEMTWNNYKKCKKQNQNSTCDWPFNDASPLDFILSVLSDGGMYKNSLVFYPEAYEEMLYRFAIGTDVKLLKSNFKKYQQYWPEEAQNYQEFISEWDMAKKLAKTAKPKPLDSAVQHHEWFYSNKQEEVLKSLVYYHKHNVRFMLEKALNHKDPVIAAKAKEYLANPIKGKEKAVGNNEAKN